ncbi:MAG: FCD domain-containing protein, partial [Pseudomonadota bacterium]
VFSVFEARISAEKTAAALAAVRSSQADKETLKAYLEELRDAQAANDEDTFFAIDRSVHDAIATMSRNPFIITQVHSMRAHTMRCWHFYRELGLTENPDFAGVNAIIKAVIAGDPKKSAAHMHTHLAKNLQEYNDMLAQQFQALNWV